MKRLYRSFLTKLLIIIASLIVVPDLGETMYAQDKGAKSVKSGKGKSKSKRSTRGSYKQRKRSSKRHWKNQDKVTRKRMKRAARNAKRRQKGKPMKNNRLV